MRKTTKVLAVLMIVVMAVSLMSTAAFADGPESYCISEGMREHMEYWAGVAKDLFEKGVKGFLDIIHPHAAAPAPEYFAGDMSVQIGGNMPEHMAQWAEVAARLAKWGIETFWQLTHPFA